MATLETDDEVFQRLVREEDLNVEEVLEEFGGQLIGLGLGKWEAQAKALRRAPFTKWR